MQSADGIERGGDRAFLPAWNIRGVFAGEHDASIDRAQVLVVLAAGVLIPDPEAAEREGHTMPGDRDAIVEFAAVLRVDLRAVIERPLDPRVRRHRGELHCVHAPDIRAEQHALAAVVKSIARVAYVHDRQVGIGDTAVDVIVLFPEAPLELQAHLDG